MRDNDGTPGPDWPQPSTALVIGRPEVAALNALRDRAAANPVTVQDLMATLTDPDAKAEHVERVSSQTVYLPAAFMASYTMEVQEAGLLRHLCVSIHAGTGVPHPAAVWLIAEALGFKDGLRGCMVYREDLTGHGIGINVMQLVQQHAAPEDVQ